MKKYIQPTAKLYTIKSHHLLAGSNEEIQFTSTPASQSYGSDSKKNNMWFFMDDDEE